MRNIRIILRIYAWGLIIATLFRFWMVYVHRKEILHDGVTTFGEFVQFVLTGWRFDILTLSFILIVPFFLLVAYSYTRKSLFRKWAFGISAAGMGLFIALEAADVSYFNKFFQHIDLKAFQWMDTPGTVFRMILSDSHYRAMILPGLLLLALFLYDLRKIFAEKEEMPPRGWKPILVYAGFFVLMFAGLRGRITHHPLRMEDAYVFHNNLLNTLALNPIFVLEKSVEEALSNDLDTYRYMDDTTAFRIVRQYLHIQQPVNANPVSRRYRYDTAGSPKNVVLILMESMGAWKMRYFGNTENRTPFLDSLFLKSMSFSRMYSAGIHTYAGIFSTHFSYPLLYGHHPMKGIFFRKFYGLPQVLKEHGYVTLFFLPHNKTFDNAGAFLSLNDFDTIYYDRDYPREQLRNVWGVSDRYLLKFSLHKIDALAQKGKPFLATVLTVSDHRPFAIPDDIEGPAEEIRATRFADRSLEEFFREARTKPWFKNTVFVFVADHGETHRMKYAVPLTYNHIPAMIYYEGVQPRIIDNIAGQIDIFPTLMHVLGFDFLNMSFGMDLLGESRSYILFNHDRLYGVIDTAFLLIADRDRTLGLYRYKNGDLTDYSRQFPEKRREMEDFLKAHLQTEAYILRNDLQKPPEDSSSSKHTTALP